MLAVWLAAGLYVGLAARLLAGLLGVGLAVGYSSALQWYMPLMLLSNRAQSFLRHMRASRDAPSWSIRPLSESDLTAKDYSMSLAIWKRQ